MEEETSTNNEFELPNEVLQILPSDPFELLDVARKITSIALSTRISVLESEVGNLRTEINNKDVVISELENRVGELDASVDESNKRVDEVKVENESLVKENGRLSSLVAKLRRDVSKLEVFRKTLMQSLEEENGSTVTDVSKGNPTQETVSGDDDVTLPPSVYSSTDTESLDRANSLLEDREPDGARPRISPSLLLASQTSTPRLTPPGSPPIKSPSKPASPRRHSVSFSTTRGMFDSTSSTASSDGGSHSGRTRIDGKEFFRQVRSRLSYEQFGAFLANVKELNSHKQTKEETLRKADEIFGPDNKDLSSIFEGLLNRNLH